MRFVPPTHPTRPRPEYWLSGSNGTTGIGMFQVYTVEWLRSRAVYSSTQ
jgi:hypothetical protein